VAAGAVSYADCSMTAGADARVKGFTDVYCRDEEGVAEDIASEGVTSEGVVLRGVLCREDREDKQRREEVIASLVRVELRRLRRDTMIISLSLTSVSASSSFVQTCCSSS
jgi:hypothetical protein